MLMDKDAFGVEKVPAPMFYHFRLNVIPKMGSVFGRDNAYAYGYICMSTYTFAIPNREDL